MQAPQYKPIRRYGFNLTPMIDVVFLLIIFFLVSSHLARQESHMQLPLPVAQTGSDDPPSVVPRITVNVQDDGSLWVRNQEVAPWQLESIFADARKLGSDASMEVRIRGSRIAPYSAVEPIMLACTKTGIWNVTFAVYREHQP